MIIKLFAAFALVVGLAVAIPARQFQYRRLDPSEPEPIEDFETSKDEDGDSIDSGATNGRFPDSPQPPQEDSEELTAEKTQRQQARLDLLSANYEQLNGQESKIFANLQLSEANQAEFQSKIEENEADARDLRHFSAWLADAAEAQKKLAEDLNGTEDASREERIGEILQEMSVVVRENADFENEAVRLEERQIELESDIRHEQEQEVEQKSEQAELQLDQIHLEHHMINNENRFRELDHELFQDIHGENGDSGFIGVGDWDGSDGAESAEEPQETDENPAPAAAGVAE